MTKQQRTNYNRVRAAAPKLLAALRLMLRTHPPRTTGECPVCHHIGQDCEANVAQKAIEIAGLQFDEFPVSDWMYEVRNGDTQLGYQEWVEHKQETMKELQ